MLSLNIEWHEKCDMVRKNTERRYIIKGVKI